MKKLLLNLNKAIKKFETGIAVVLLIIIVFFVFISAVLRYMNYSIVWSLDFSLLLFAWMSFFACSTATRKKSHIGVTLLVENFPLKLQRITKVVNDILMIGFMCFMVHYSIYAARLNFRQKIYTMGISYSFVTLSLAIGGIFIIIALIAQLIEHILIFSGKKSTAELTLY